MNPRYLSAAIAMLALTVVPLTAQRAVGPGPDGAPQTPRTAAPFDLTGTWVSVVTEDWRWRMLLPQKGDYSSVPLNAEGRKVADTWDPARIASDGCKPFGAPAVMRVPGRLRISWESDTVLMIETDAGRQTRRLAFSATSAPVERTWQGSSRAEWQPIVQPGGQGVSLQRAAPHVGALKVVTTNLRAGYLRKNGVPYSESAVLTEYFDRLTAFDTDWVVVLSVLEDPTYLDQPFITSTHFKREPAAAKWAPTPCEAAARK